MKIRETDIEQIRQLAIKSLPKFGVSTTEPNWEVSLMAGGCQLGQRFEFDGLQVYWLRASNAIKFYDPD